MLRMRTFTVAVGLAVVLSALATPSLAQAPGGGGGMMGMGGGQGSSVMVLLAPSVQEELALTADQKAKIYKLSTTANQKGRDLMQSRFLGNSDQQGMMRAGMQLRQENEKAVAGILDAKQKERYDQIVLQAEGPLAVARPEIAAKLRLNDTQNEYVQGIMMEMRQRLVMSIKQGAATGQVTPAQVRELTKQLRKNAVQQVKKVIDRKQQVAFDKMLGAPFDVTKLDSETAAAESAPAPAPSASDSTEPKDASPGDAAKEKEETPKAPPSTPARKKGRAR